MIATLGLSSVLAGCGAPQYNPFENGDYRSYAWGDFNNDKRCDVAFYRGFRSSGSQTINKHVVDIFLSRQSNNGVCGFVRSDEISLQSLNKFGEDTLRGEDVIEKIRNPLCMHVHNCDYLRTIRLTSMRDKWDTVTPEYTLSWAGDMKGDLLIGDVNKDGNNDLVFVKFIPISVDGKQDVKMVYDAVALGNGDGTFRKPVHEEVLRDFDHGLTSGF